MYITTIDGAIARLQSYTPITEEDKATFEIAINALKFAKDFTEIDATPEKMKHAITLMNELEYIFGQSTVKEKVETLKLC